MVGLLKQSSTAQPLVFLMTLASDHISPATGLTPSVSLSKNGNAFAGPSGAVSEIANGWYKVAGNATDTGTLGPLILHATATGADPTDEAWSVVAFDPQSANSMITGVNGLAPPTNWNAMAISGAGAVTVGTLSNAVQGVLAQIRTGYNTVLYVRKGGSDSAPNDGSNAAPYLTIAKAISVASAYTVICVGPGVFDEGTTSLVLPTDVSLIGCHRDVTTILSQVVSTGNSGVIVKPGTRSLVADLTIQGNAASGVSQVPLGCESFDPGFTNARFERLRLIADADGIYISGSVSSFVAEDVQIDTNYDCLAFFSPVTYTLRRVTARALGPSSISSGATARALNIQSASCVGNVYDSSFLAQDATTTTTGIENSVGSTLRLFGNTSVRSSSSAGTVKDITTTGTATSAGGNVVYDSTKVTGTVVAAGASGRDHGRVLNPTATVGYTNTTIGTATAIGTPGVTAISTQLTADHGAGSYVDTGAGAAPNITVEMNEISGT